MDRKEKFFRLFNTAAKALHQPHLNHDDWGAVAADAANKLLAYSEAMVGGEPAPKLPNVVGGAAQPSAPSASMLSTAFVGWPEAEMLRAMMAIQQIVVAAEFQAPKEAIDAARADFEEALSAIMTARAAAKRAKTTQA